MGANYSLYCFHIRTQRPGGSKMNMPVFYHLVRLPVLRSQCLQFTKPGVSCPGEISRPSLVTRRSSIENRASSIEKSIKPFPSALLRVNSKLRVNSQGRPFCGLKWVLSAIKSEHVKRQSGEKIKFF